MSVFINGQEYPPYKCKLCGLGYIRCEHDICRFCFWEDDDLQQDMKDFAPGANRLTYNQYKAVWDKNKEMLMKKFPGGVGVSDEIRKIFEANPKIYGTYTEEQKQTFKELYNEDW